MKNLAESYDKVIGSYGKFCVIKANFLLIFFPLMKNNVFQNIAATNKILCFTWMTHKSSCKNIK